MTVNLSNFKREDYVKQFWMYNYQVTLPKSKVAQNRHWRGSDYVLKGPGEIFCLHLQLRDQIIILCTIKSLFLYK